MKQNWIYFIAFGLLSGITIYILGPENPHFPQNKHNEKARPTLVDDSAKINPTKVKRVVAVKSTKDIVTGLKWAKQHQVHVSISGKRLSQGSHTFIKDGLVLDMSGFNQILNLDQKNKKITVQSGTTWAQIQNYVWPHKLAVRVQQSSNIFTVGGSLGVNCHGRDIQYGPIISTVDSFKLVTASGKTLNVDRSGNPELFGLTIGGLGLIGVVTEVTLNLTQDQVYQVQTQKIDYQKYFQYLKKLLANQKNIGLHFGRLSIVPGPNFLQEMFVTTYRRVSASNFFKWKPNPKEYVKVPKFFFDWSRKSDYGKKIRWNLEKNVLYSKRQAKLLSRNNAMRPAYRFFFEHQSPKDRDILQEYFVPVEKFPQAIERFRKIFRKRKVNLLNITIRYVPANKEAVLSYAPVNSVALVLYMNIDFSPKGLEKAKTFTRELVTATLNLKGRYYLPYQRWPSLQQLKKSYPNLDDFIQLKKKYDPGLLFQTEFSKFYRLFSTTRKRI